MEAGHQQESQQGGIHVEIQATEENLAIEMNKNKHCINNYPGIEISESDETICKNPENDMKQSHMDLKQNLIPKLHSMANSHINTYSGIKQAKLEEAKEMSQSDVFQIGSQEVPPFPAGSVEQGQGDGSHDHCILTVKAEIHNI